MTLLQHLEDKLRFVERHYQIASEAFQTIKRQIENGEPPYEPPLSDLSVPLATDFGEPSEEHDDDAETDSYDPPFIEEWIETDESLNLLGCSCLCMVHAALLDYLRAFLEFRGDNLPSGKGSLLSRYRDFFVERYGIDWSQGPVPFETLEDLTLARNSIQHETKITSRYALITRDHAKRFPDSPFGGLLGQVLVPEETLMAAGAAVGDFCRFVAGQ